MQKKSVLLVAACLPLLWSCGGNKAPSGQVVARINGEEVTVGELNHEAQARGVTNADNPAVKQQLLQSIVDRKLLAEAAVERKVDRSPEFLVAQKRAQELMLADMFVRKAIAGEVQEPTRDATEAFARSRPAMFDQRTIFTIDQISFPRPNSQDLVRQLALSRNLQDVETILAGARLPRERMTATWDSARMPEQLVNQLKGLPAGEVFVQLSNPAMAGVIVGMKPAPVGPEARTALASQAVKQERIQTSARQWLETARRGAKVEYQRGFEPPAKGAPKAAPAPGAAPAAAQPKAADANK